MPTNGRMATATQALCVIAYLGPEGTTSEVVARSLDTNPVVVRRLVKQLERGRLVRVRPGKSGGVRLAMPAHAITLGAVRRAIDGEDGVFACRPGGNPACPINSRMPGLLGPIFAAADRAVDETLAGTTIADLVARLPTRTA